MTIALCGGRELPRDIQGGLFEKTRAREMSHARTGMRMGAEGYVENTDAARGIETGAEHASQEGKMKGLILALASIGAMGLVGCGSQDRGCDCCSPAASPTRAPEGSAVYRCSHDGGTRTTPGPCPKCGMTLSEKQ